MRRCALITVKQPVDYSTGLALQDQARVQVLAGTRDGVVILLEHRPVITIGRGGGAENLRAEPAVLRAQGIELRESDRGGNVTCHNPGQLVGYPVLNLSRWQEDVHWYVNCLEETLIGTLARFGLRAGRKAQYTGVWLADKKIAAIGVAARKWITGHGFALNVCNDLDLFQTVVPCGIRQFGVTSLAAQGVAAPLRQVAAVWRQEFGRVFDCEISEAGQRLQFDVMKDYR